MQVSTPDAREVMATLLTLCEVALPYRDSYSITYLISKLREVERYKEVSHEVLREVILTAPKSIYHHRVVLTENQTMLHFS